MALGRALSLLPAAALLEEAASLAAKKASIDSNESPPLIGTVSVSLAL
jgi:hypothetical protein